MIASDEQNKTALILLDGPLNRTENINRGYWKYFYHLIAEDLIARGYSVELLDNTLVKKLTKFLKPISQTDYLAEYFSRIFQAIGLAFSRRSPKIVIGVHGTTMLYAFLRRLTGKLPHSKIYIFLYFSYAKEGVLNSLKRWFIRTSLSHPNITILSITPRQQAEYQEWFRVPRENVLFIPYAIDTDFFLEPSVKEMPYGNYILCPGDYERDDELLFKACRNLNINIVRLTKEGRYEPSIRQLAIKYGLSDRVTILTHVDEHTVRALYHNCLFVVLPVRNALHPCGLTCLMEAMTSSKATILSRGLTSDYYSADMETALLYEPGNSEELKNKINLLITNELLRDQIGLKARQKARIEFEVHDYARKFLDILATV